MQTTEAFNQEQARAAWVQQLLMAIIEQSRDYSKSHDGTIKMLLSDAWEELRLRPTAMSVQDLDTLGNEIHRFELRKAMLGGRADQYARMLASPYFARLDFHEDGQRDIESIIIGLYSLQDPDGNSVVYDWRAPISGLYYDAMPGNASYEAPGGTISGQLSLKRQYRFEDGKLQYFVDTDVAIEDGMLMDILSGATTARMRSIVSTIQREQNKAVRSELAGVLSVVGCAGSGKTSVAMHRAAFLMYRNRNLLGPDTIATLSPTSAFSEYISTVLPDLGEQNTRMPVLRQLYAHVIGIAPEPPLKQVERLSQPAYTLRRESVGHKSGSDFIALIDRYIKKFTRTGPEFSDLVINGQLIIGKAELESLYRSQFKVLNPCLRITRIEAVLKQKLDNCARLLQAHYQKQLAGRYKGRELDIAAKLAASERLAPARAQIRRMVKLDPLMLYANAISELPEPIAQAAVENAEAQLIWWEDAPAIAYLMLKLGFAMPDKTIRHLLVDEVQDYPLIALSCLHLLYPRAQITLLGDPNQRTSPGMPMVDPAQWGTCFGLPNAEVVQLNKCYRSTAPITRLCNTFLPDNQQAQPFGREGEPPVIKNYLPDTLLKQVNRWAKEGKRIAVITRALPEAIQLAKLIKGAWLIEDEESMMPETGGIVVSCYHLLKGLEFDAVAVVWPDVELDDNEHRRLYTACSRALHNLALMGEPKLIKALGIVT